MSYGHPDERDVLAILDAAGCHDLSPAQMRRARLALARYTATVHPRICQAKDRWKSRALYVRDKYAPTMDWGDSEAASSPTV